MATSDIKKGPLYVDSTNNRVGIGTSSPNTNAEIVGGSTGSTTNLLQIRSNASTANTGSTIRFTNSDTATSAYGAAEITALRIDVAGDTDLVFKPSKAGTISEAMRIQGDTGNVGIGNSDPQHKFHITHSGTGAIPTDYQMGATSPNDNYQGIHNNNNSATFSGLALETRTSGASRWLIANEWKNTYLGDLVFRNRNGGVTSQESMRIDSSGRVTMPYQPSFAATRNQGDVTNAVYVYPNVYHNIGGHYNNSNGRFTAPVTGSYFISANHMTANNGTYNNYTYEVRVNGSLFQYVYSSNGGNLHHRWNWHGVMYLQAGDYVEVFIPAGFYIYGQSSLYQHFSGYLIG